MHHNRTETKASKEEQKAYWNSHKEAVELLLRATDKEVPGSSCGSAHTKPAAPVVPQPTSHQELGSLTLSKPTYVLGISP